MVPDSGRHSPHKKPKIRIISSPKSDASGNVTVKNSNLEDKTAVPLSPSRSMEGSEGRGDLGDGRPNS